MGASNTFNAFKIWYTYIILDHAGFVDGTFRVVPQGFYQLLIYMIYDKGSELYIPVVYGLVQNKTQLTYQIFLQKINMLTHFKFSATTITCDFEKGLINACKEFILVIL